MVELENVAPASELMHTWDWLPHWVGAQKNHWSVVRFVDEVLRDCDVAGSYFEIMNRVKSGSVEACDDEECPNWAECEGIHFDFNPSERWGTPVWYLD